MTDTIDESHLEELAAEYDELRTAHQAERSCTQAAQRMWGQMMEIRHELADAQPVTDAGMAAVSRVVPGTSAWLEWKRSREGVSSLPAPTPTMHDPVLALIAEHDRLEVEMAEAKTGWACDAVCDIIIVTREEIVETPAATAAGLRGKARVLAEILRAEERDDQNTRAVLSIVTDIERLVEGRGLS